MNLSRIDASLTQGKLFTGAWIAFIYVWLAACLALPLITILMLIMTFTVGLEWNGLMIFALVFGNIFLGLIAIVPILVIVRNNKLKRKINLWLLDAVQVKARSQTVDSFRIGFWPKRVRIRVEFKLNGKKYSFLSADKMLGDSSDGYNRIWARYCDREIDILFSPEYGEVLILKDNK